MDEPGKAKDLPSQQAETKDHCKDARPFADKLHILIDRDDQDEIGQPQKYQGNAHLGSV